LTLWIVSLTGVLLIVGALRFLWKERHERILLSFFATRVDGSSAAFLRVLLGLLAAWQCGAVWLNLRRYWGADGMIPWDMVEKDQFIWLSPFSWAPKSTAVLNAHAIVFTFATVCVLLGFRARIFTLVLAYVHMSLQFRNPYILNSGDRLFMIVAALAAFTPLSRKLSIDAWLARRKPGKPLGDLSSVWGQRILGLQISYVYLNSAVAKLGNKRWQEGMALRDVLASPVFAEWPTYIDSRAIIYFLTYSTLAFELSFPVLVWFKKFRPFMLLAGIGFHMGIDIMMVIPIFSYAMLAAYPVFLTDGETRWLFDKLLLRKRKSAQPSAAPDPEPRRKKRRKKSTERNARRVPRPDS